MKIQSKFMTTEVRTTAVRMEGRTVILEGRIKEFLPVRVEVTPADAREVGALIAGKAWERARAWVPAAVAVWLEERAPVLLTRPEPPPAGFGLRDQEDGPRGRPREPVEVPASIRRSAFVPPRPPEPAPAPPGDGPASAGATRTGRALLAAARKVKHGARVATEAAASSEPPLGEAGTGATTDTVAGPDAAGGSSGPESGRRSRLDPARVKALLGKRPQSSAATHTP